MPPSPAPSRRRRIGVLLLLAAAVILSAQVDVANAHARLMQPPSRASMWRKGYGTPADFNDNQGFCGGFLHQYNVNEGKCGICGDPWDAEPRNHESPGGVFATGTITETYRPGEDIDVEVDVTANHMGYFTFKLCANNNTAEDPEQACFDKTVLPVLPHFGHDYPLPSRSTGTYMLKLRLPDDVWCKQCILQWTYTCGNNWGTCPDGSGAVGCGPQEMFRACSDIAIEGAPVDHSNEIEGSTLGIDPTTTPRTLTTHTPPAWTPGPTVSIPPGTAGNAQCRSAGAWAGQASMDDWCMVHCNYSPPDCPATHCECDDGTEDDQV